MHETVEEVLHYARLIVSKKRAAMICAFVVCMSGWAVIAFLPNQYQVEATIQVERSSMLQPLLKGITVESDVAAQLAGLMRQTMLVPKNLEQIAHEIGLDAEAKTPEALELLVGKMEKDIDISALGEKDKDKRGIYTVTYKNSDPAIAQRVVQVLIDRFIDSIIAAIRADAENTRLIIEEQVGEYKTKVESAGLRIKEFKQQHLDVLSEDGRPYYSRLIEARASYRQALLELHEAEQEVDSMRDETHGTTTSASSRRKGGIIHPLDARIQEGEKTLAELQLKYTDLHPDVIATTNLLEQLKQQRRGSPSNAKAPTEDGDNYIDQETANPAYQAWKSLLTRAEARVASLNSRVTEYKHRMDELQQGISTVPQLEAELANLNRDYVIQEDSYQKLVERKESLTISNKVERASDLKINLLEPPIAPKHPIKPNRLLLNALALLLGIGSGAGVALLISMSNPVIWARRDLRKITDIPILGTVSIDVSLVKPEPIGKYVLALGALLLLFVCINLLYLFRVKFLLNLAGAFPMKSPFH
jgi:polysaccharide chain length determinant protein (PEP-CTERM system associated)